MHITDNSWSDELKQETVRMFNSMCRNQGCCRFCVKHKDDKFAALESLPPYDNIQVFMSDDSGVETYESIDELIDPGWVVD